MQIEHVGLVETSLQDSVIAVTPDVLSLSLSDLCCPFLELSWSNKAANGQTSSFASFQVLLAD